MNGPIVEQAAAIQIAEQAREESRVPAELVFRTAERRIIEVCSGEGAEALVRDARVWIVRFQQGPRWVELAVDETTAEVLRTQRSLAP